jgi:hypothetical protein
MGLGSGEKANSTDSTGNKKLCTTLEASSALVDLAAWIPLGSKGPVYWPEIARSSGRVYEIFEAGTPLSPSPFAGQPACANQIAREIPEILDQLYCYCYCECDKHLGHHSLLSCFVDSHAAT